MAREIRSSSKRPSKVHLLSRKHADRARKRAHSQVKDKRKEQVRAAIGDVYEYAPSKVRRAKVALSLDRHELQQGRSTSDDERDLGGLGPDVMKKLHARLMQDSDDADRDEAGRVDSEDDEEIESEDAYEDEDEDDIQISASDSEDDSPEALAKLETILSGMNHIPALKRKPDEIAQPIMNKRRHTDDHTEVGEESEFGVRGSGVLDVDDLIAPLKSYSSSAALATLKKSTKSLTSSSAKTKTLSAPLPQRAQERLDREAAYEQTKGEVDKWSATMKRVKEAEHLSFPLQAEKPGRVSNLELAAKFTPSNELESAVDKLLKSAQLRDEDIAQTEALKMAHLSVEEVAARRAELRTMRELAFRADKKAKRIAKIKSKTYRRIRKKQRERLDGVDENLDGDAEDEETRLKAEVQRARERATLRHKNTGKWAREMKGREGLDQDQRQAITDMLERGEKLTRRIRGENSGDEETDEDEDDDDQDEDQIKRNAFDELAALRAEDDDDLTDIKSKSVFDMKFMREAAARQSREADARAEEFQRELGVGINEEGRDEEEEDGADSTAATLAKEATTVQRTGGRVSFRPGTTPGPLRSLGSLASDVSSVTLQSADLLQDASAPDLASTPSPSTPVSVTPVPAPTPASTLTSNPTTMPNPWLVPVAPSGPSRKRNEVRVHKDADSLTKSSNKLKKQGEKREDERERARDDAVLEIDANDVLVIPEPPDPAPSGTSGKKGKKGKDKGKGRKEGGRGQGQGTSSAAPDEDEGRDDDSDLPSEVEEQERAAEGMRVEKGVKAFQQRELVALAFAGDNVVQTFEEAKRRETEADAPHEVDTTLPGWGTWGGTGTKRLPIKSHLIKTVPGIMPASRADHNKPRLIVSEKRDKKAAKYLVNDLPHPYTGSAQFERQMAAPLGSEWNTRVGFQRGTLPRVVKKMGTVIDPLERLF